MHDCSGVFAVLAKELMRLSWQPAPGMDDSGDRGLGLGLDMQTSDKQPR